VLHVAMTVIEEIDTFKRELGENGRNARQFSRFIDVLRSEGSLANGVKLEKSDATLIVTTDNYVGNLPKDLNPEKADSRILGTAIHLKDQYPNDDVELVSKDINLRIKADVYGVIAKDYEPDSVSVDELYAGYIEIEVDPNLIDEFYAKKLLPEIPGQKLLANQYVIMKDKSNPNHSAIARYSMQQQGLVPLIHLNESVWGIFPRNVEQSFALDCLLNDEILMVTLVGKAGTGKTLIALAAGLAKTLDEGKYR